MSKIKIKLSNFGAKKLWLKINGTHENNAIGRPKKHNCFCLSGYTALTEDWHLILITPNTSKIVIFSSFFWAKYTSKNSSQEKENLHEVSFLQNNCIITKAVEILSENNRYDRLWNIKALPQQVQQFCKSLCSTATRDFLILLCQEKTDREGKKYLSTIYY